MTDGHTPSLAVRLAATLRALRWPITIATVAAMLYLLWDAEDLGHRLQAVPLPDMAALSLMVVLTWLTQGLGLQVLLIAFGVAIKTREATSMTFATIALNYLPAKAGTVMRAAVLKTRHALAYRDFLWLSAIRFSSVMAASAAVLLAWLALSRSLPGSAVSAGVLMGALVLTLGPALLPGRWIGRPTMPRNTLALTHLLVWAQLLLVGLRLWIAAAALGVDLSLTEALLIAPAMTLSTLLNITPGAIGIRELVAGFIASQIGIDFELVLLAAVVDRTAMILMTLIVCVPSVLRESQRLATPRGSA